jgi:hypothetical protein
VSGRSASLSSGVIGNGGMAYLNLLASVPEPEVERLRRDPTFVVTPTLVTGASHLLAYWVQTQPLGSLLGQALDGGSGRVTARMGTGARGRFRARSDSQLDGQGQRARALNSSVSSKVEVLMKRLTKVSPIDHWPLSDTVSRSPIRRWRRSSPGGARRAVPY